MNGNHLSSQLAEDLARATNVGEILRAAARSYPDTIAVAESPRRPGRGRQYYRQLNYQALDQLASSMAARLQQRGIAPGTRLALMVPPSIEFVALFFALLRAGMVGILIDPGMGKKNLIRCLSEARPAGLIGIRRAQLARWLFRKSLPDCRLNFSVQSSFPGTERIDRPGPAEHPFVAPTGLNPESPAAIIFTTGSTGPPKGVLYRQRTFLEQARDIRHYFDLPAGGVDISGFPLFALFNAAMAVTTVFPRMDFTRPAQVNPRLFVQTIEDWSATQSFGSPALWHNVTRYCSERGVRLPTIKNVLSAGAPVAPTLLERIQALIADDGNVHTPYGATEALPIACITAATVLRETAQRTRDGAGTCVGHRFPHIEWRVIEISDQPLPSWSECKTLPPGEIGELVVSGPVVTDQYVTRTDANPLHKIPDGKRIWHRMGDVGYLDDQDRFWFCGRKAHRVRTDQGTLFTIPCEAIFNQHPAVYRSALVGVGLEPHLPAMVVEPHADAFPSSATERAQLLDELHARGRSHRLTQGIRHILVRRQLPVDIRHNAKIFREQLAIWAAKQLAERKESFRP